MFMQTYTEPLNKIYTHKQILRQKRLDSIMKVSQIKFMHP